MPTTRMTTTTTRKRLAPPLIATAQALLARPVRFEELLAKLPPKERLNAERRIDAFEAAGQGAGPVTLWRRLACALMTLAPLAKVVGKQTIQFFIPDGKYRMQVFALEDLQDGNMTIYCPDVMAECVEAGVFAQSGGSEEEGASPAYSVVSTGEPMHVDALDKHAINPANHYKDLIGWNRKAVRITLPASATDTQIEAAEIACAVAATHFPPPAVVAAPA
jgi:hypothetical protein